MLFGEHHESHAASAFYPSPFEQAAIVTMDGVGEWATSSIGVGRGHEIEMLRELRFPHSLGLLYSAFTYFTGFQVNSGEYKVMGLAPYGEPKYVKTHQGSPVEIRDDGSLWMNMEYFTYPHGLTMTGDGVRAAVRRPGAPAGEQADAARDGSRAVDPGHHRRGDAEDGARSRTAKPGMRDLCLAGGVALNCVGNGRLLREGPFEQIWIQPAAGDAGGALGVALASGTAISTSRASAPKRSGTWERPSRPRAGAAPPRYADGMSGSFLGPRFTDDEIARVRRRERLRRAPARAAPTLADAVAGAAGATRRSSACSRAAWSSARARSAAARSSATRGRRRCSR